MTEEQEHDFYSFNAESVGDDFKKEGFGDWYHLLRRANISLDITDATMWILHNSLEIDDLRYKWDHPLSLDESIELLSNISEKCNTFKKILEKIKDKE